LAICLALAWSNSFSVPFMFDDRHTIVDNPGIRSLSPARVLDPSLCPSLEHRPLVSYSLAMNYALGGLDVRGYHIFNFTVHLLSALVLLLLLDFTFRTKPMAALLPRSRARELALACTLLWAVHPLQVQSVTYVIQRCESLMGLFFLATVYAAARGFASESRRTAWHGLALVFLAFSAGSKEIAAMAPVVVLLYDLIFFGGRPRRALARSPLLYGGLALGLLAFLLVFGGAALSFWSLEASGAAIPDRPHNSLQYALTQPKVLAYYLYLTFWPGPLSLDHAWKVIPFSRTWPYALGLLAVAGLTLRGVLARRAWAFAVAWCLVILAPTSSFFGTRTIAVEHRMYLPLAGIVCLTALSVYLGGAALVRRGLFSSRLARALGVGLLVAVALALMGRTWLHNQDFRSRVAIWENAVRLSPDHPRPRENLASALAEAGQYTEAIQQAEKALELDPDSTRALVSLGLAYSKMGDNARALEAYKRAWAMDGNAPDLAFSLGNLMVQEKNYEKAAQLFGQETRAHPDDFRALNNLANTLILLGRTDEAITAYQRVLELNPGNHDARGNLGMALVSVHRDQEALELLPRALKARPDNARFHKFLGVALARTGDLKGGAKHLERALELDPEDQEARGFLAKIRKAGE